jgi:hypothetical protein
MMETIHLRWRVVDGKIPLLQRHYRALQPLELPPPLMAWIHERLEWATVNMLHEGSDAVLCLAINPHEDVVVSLDETRPKPQLGKENILIQDDVIVGLTYNGEPLQGTLWLEQDGALIATLTPSMQQLITATDTLTKQLVETLGIGVTAQQVSAATALTAGALFVVSDEFGFIPLRGTTKLLSKIADSFTKVFAAPS